MQQCVLNTEGLYSGYGPIPVLHGINMSVPSAGCVALLGRNGAGKTTLIKTLVGLLNPTAGRILLDGRDIGNLRPNRIARAGIAYVPQGRGIFPRLSVQENLQLGTRAAAVKTGIPDDVYRFFPILKERSSQLAGTLSGGQQQMLAIGRALCAQPKVMLLDEPSEGVQPSIVQEIGETLAELVRNTGISLLLVEQNLDLALSLAQNCVVLEKGEIVHRGSSEELRDEAVQAKFLAL